MVFLSHVKTKDIDVTIFLYMQAGFMVTTYTYYKCTTDHIDVYTQKKRHVCETNGHPHHQERQVLQKITHYQHFT